MHPFDVIDVFNVAPLIPFDAIDVYDVAMFPFHSSDVIDVIDVTMLPNCVM